MKRFDLLKLPDILITILFLVIITAVLWVPLLQIQDLEKYEKRELASMPEIQWNDSLLAFPEEFRLYFSDNFPLRYRMLRLSNQIRYHIFQERFLSTAIVGEDGWLYYDNPKYLDICQNSIDWRNFDRYTEKINSTQKFLDSQGVEFAIAFIPEKCHIYSEPIQRILPDFQGRSSTLPLIDHISSNSEVTVISLFDILNSQKNDEQLFYKNDTHWSSIGAYLGYQEIITTLNPDISPQEMIPWNYETDVIPKEWIGDLGSFTSLPEFITETIFLPKVKYQTQATKLGSGELIFENPAANNDLTLVVFCDSFFGVPPIARFLAAHYRQTVILSTNNEYKWSNNPADLQNLVDKWDPDIILVAYIERNINYLLGD